MHALKWVIVCVAATLGGFTSAFATDVDITTHVTTLPAIDLTLGNSPRVNLSTGASPSYAQYMVTLDPYNQNTHETFNPIYFKATTTVINVGEGDVPVAGQVARFDFTGAVYPSPDCTVTTTPTSATSTIECKLTFSPNLISNGPNSAPFTVTVLAPTAGQRIKFVSETRWFEVVSPHGCGSAPPGNFPAVNPPCLETEGPKPAIYFDLISPTATPTIAQTVLPFSTGGTVTTGTGAATCDNPWVVSVKVPQAATVSLNSNPGTEPQAATCASGTCQYFARLAIPGTFAPTNPLVTTLRRDRCTIEGRGIIGKALQILEESIYYRGDSSSNYLQLFSCRTHGGPSPGVPCIASRGIYTIFNLPNVPDKLSYWGDHFWIIYSTENGRYGTP